MSKIILGISAFYHDSAAALLVDGEIIAAAQEERFSRKKHDASFPIHAIRYVLEEAGVRLDEVSKVVFYDKPWLKFERLLETYHAFAPSGLLSFLKAMPVWIKDKLFMKQHIRKQLNKIAPCVPPILFSEHHLSHAASAFYPSPFQEAAILTIDGVGEWATTTIGHGQGDSIKIIKELHFPHSLGLLYAAFTYFLGFEVNGGEYKLMGLASYGNPEAPQTQEFVDKILTHLVDIREDGSLLLNMAYFAYATGLRMIHTPEWKRLFGIAPRQADEEILQVHMNLSKAIQIVTERVIIQLAKTTRKITQCDHLVMAGGVALNCVANAKLLNAGIFEKIWIQPAAGDAGGALGAAYAAWHIFENEPRKVSATGDAMQGAYLGPEFSYRKIYTSLRKHQLTYQYFENFDELVKICAQKIANGKVIGWFQGRMEFGPRALGNRSILGDARNPDMQRRVNVKIKFRESFRPFAPAVLKEDVFEYFDFTGDSPYMLITAPLLYNRRMPEPDNYPALNLYERLYHCRSELPAITHIDYSARLQTVCQQSNKKLYSLLQAFKEISGYGLVVNTSFNIKDEPIVCSPEDAVRCYQRTDMDCLVMENFLLEKKT
ncbi:carbamoyltransferase [Catalinimonas alkaloidigena]|uniref:carbamoyltransferase family protein n=1 Tax=Catalinimonas alkaloidigena TaxID=1075417 RepID=UPI0024059815|nr:carbamoyltransferase [Catalinimonas alkaloidigena]MDF9796376.1 carbamoyltransferase [Catalinimonas alkaloidigena]